MNLLSGIEFVQQQGERGRALGKESKLNRLAGQAYGAAPMARPEILQQAVATDADAGLALGRALDSDEDRRNQTMANMARTLVSAPAQARAGLYQQMLPSLQRFGLSNLPTAYDEASAPIIDETANAIVQASLGAAGSPTGYREFQLKAQAAGLKPGSPEYQEAANIALGRTGRAPSGGFGFEVFEGQDGKKRMRRTNPRTGAVEMYDETTGDFVPLGGGAGLNPGAPAPGAPAAARGPVQEAGGMPVVFDNPGAVPPQVMAAIQANPDGWGAVPDGTTARIGPQQGAPARGAILGVGQSAAEKAFAEANAKNMAEIASYDQMTRLEAEREAASVRAKGAAEAQVAQQYGTDDSRKAAREAAQKLPQLQNAVRGVARIETALRALDRGTLADTGPLDQFAQRYTQAGQELESAVGAIQNSMLSLTRVPGVGSQSDLEARVANMQYPSLDKSPEVNRNTMANLRLLVRDLQEAYGNVTRAQVPGQGGGQAAPAAPSGASVQRARNPQTGQIVEFRNGQWVPAR